MICPICGKPLGSNYKCGHCLESRESCDKMDTETPTLRDQFAMAALTGLLKDWEFDDLTADAIKILTQKAYQIADAMLEARAKNDKGGEA